MVSSFLLNGFLTSNTPEWKVVMKSYQNVSSSYLMVKSVKFFHVEDDFG